MPYTHRRRRMGGWVAECIKSNNRGNGCSSSRPSVSSLLDWVAQRPSVTCGCLLDSQEMPRTTFPRATFFRKKGVGVSFKARVQCVSTGLCERGKVACSACFWGLILKGRSCGMHGKGSGVFLHSVLSAWCRNDRQRGEGDTLLTWTE